MSDIADPDRLERYEGGALVVWWDLGPEVRPETLRLAQGLVADVVSAATVLTAIEASGGYAEGFLLRRNRRLYLRRDTSQRLEEARPAVAAAGYSNPWWQILADPAALVGVGVAVGAGVVGAGKVLDLVNKFLDAAKNAQLHSLSVKTERARLTAELRKYERTSEIADQAEAVDTTGSGLHEGPPEVGGGQRPEASRRLPDSAIGSRGQLPPPGPYQPSVPDTMAPTDAVVALTSHRAITAVAQLLAVMEQRGGEFEAKFLNSSEANERLPLVAGFQRDLSLLARGEIDVDRFVDLVEDRITVSEADGDDERRRQLPGQAGRAGLPDHGRPPRLTGPGPEAGPAGGPDSDA